MSGEEMRTPPPEWTAAAEEVLRGTGLPTAWIMLAESWEFCVAGNEDGVVPIEFHGHYHVRVFPPEGTVTGSGETLEAAVSEAREHLRTHLTDDKR